MTNLPFERRIRPGFFLPFLPPFLPFLPPFLPFLPPFLPFLPPFLPFLPTFLPFLPPFSLSVLTSSAGAVSSPFLPLFLAFSVVAVSLLIVLPPLSFVCNYTDNRIVVWSVFTTLGPILLRHIIQYCFWYYSCCEHDYSRVTVSNAAEIKCGTGH